MTDDDYEIDYEADEPSYDYEPELAEPEAPAPSSTPEYVTRAEAMEMQDRAAEKAAKEALKAFMEPRNATERTEEYSGGTGSDAVRELRATMQLEESMIREARAEVGELTQEAEDELRGWIGKFQTPEQLREAKRQGVHKIIAESAFYRAMKAGKVAPKSVGDYVRPEPVSTSAPIRISASMRSEIAEYERQLGIKFTDEDIKDHIRGRR